MASAAMKVKDEAGSGPGRASPVVLTPELERVLKIPRRSWTQNDLERLAQQLTQAIRKSHGTMELRPVQAAALYELGRGKKGVFCTARVGAGKTLISLLAPYFVGSKRPLLLIPAKLLKKTKREAAILAQHWPIAKYIGIETYEKLSRVQSADLLEVFKPDLIIADEVHKLKNLTAGCTKRVKRYMDANPSTMFVALSGTVSKRSIIDYWHILKWTHKEDRPQPSGHSEVESWALAIDEKVNPLQRKSPGALLRLCNELELDLAKQDAIKAVRNAYQRRLVETAGVIHTSDIYLGASLQIEAKYLPADAATIGAFGMLRHDWERPDGIDLGDPVEIYRHARQMSLGFYYRWNPQPPEDWMEARRNWNRLVRYVLEHNRLQLDTELMVVQAIDRGVVEGIGTLNAWRKLRDSFKPNVEAVWISDTAIQACVEWMQKNPGIVWVEHTEFGNKLMQVTNVPYFSNKGMCKGRFIEDHKRGRPMIASIASNSEGRNLQAKWSANLMTSPMPNGMIWEQTLGRTHRDGQEEDEVTCDVLVGCFEHVKAWDQATKDAQYLQSSLGQPQKILFADTDMPSLSEYLTKTCSGLLGDCRMHAQDQGG
jgi:hypothetical protein